MIFGAITLFIGCLIGWNTKQPSRLTSIRESYFPTNRPR